MMTSKKHYVEGKFGQIHTEDFGSGPSIIMHHQAPTDNSAFRRAAPIIAMAGYRVILVDTPGFGMSDGPDQPPTVEELAETTYAVASQMCQDQVVVLGHHTGSMIATEAALQFPELIRGIVLYAPLIFSEAEVTEWKTSVVGHEKNWKLKTDGSHYQYVWDYITSFVTEVKDLEGLHWITMSALKAGAEFWYAHNACINYNHKETLQQLNESTLPSMIITNTGDACNKMASRAVELCKNIEHIALEGGSIDFANEYPEQWAEAVIQFMKGL